MDLMSHNVHKFVMSHYVHNVLMTHSSREKLSPILDTTFKSLALFVTHSTSIQ